MILTSRIANVLKSFSTISAELHVANGILHTKNISATIYCRARFEVQAEELWIYDIKDFLRDNMIGSEICAYEFENPIQTTPRQVLEDLSKHGVDFEFFINDKVVRLLTRNIWKVIIESDGDNLSIYTQEYKQEPIQLVSTPKEMGVFRSVLAGRNIKHLETSNTKIQISKKGAVQFTSKNLVSIVALESESTYE